MSSVRVLGSLRRPANLRAINQDDGIRVLKDGSVAAAMTAAFLLGASPAAIAQSTQTLPQVTVEGKKSAPKKKAANTKAAPPLADWEFLGRSRH